MSQQSPYYIELTPEEREQIERLVHSYTARHALVQRAKIIQLAAEGWDNTRIADQVGLPRQIVSKWRKRFFFERVEGLSDRPRPGRPRAFPPSGGSRGQSGRLCLAQRDGFAPFPVEFR